MTLDYDEFLAGVQRDAERPGQDDAVCALLAAAEAAVEPDGGPPAARPTSRARR